MAHKGMVTSRSGNILIMPFQVSRISLWPGYRLETHPGLAGGAR